jgi:hypothetical protein
MTRPGPPNEFTVSSRPRLVLIIRILVIQKGFYTKESEMFIAAEHMPLPHHDFRKEKLPRRDEF